MLAALLLATSAFASDPHIAIFDTDPDIDGICTPILLVWSDTEASVFEDDGWAPNLANHRFYLDPDLDPGCEPMPGLVGSQQCGPTRTYSDGSHSWRIELDPVSEGEFGTLNLVTYIPGALLEDMAISDTTSWSCGECVLAADIDGDGAVTMTDYLDLLAAMGATVSAGDPRDITGDGQVDGQDLAELVSSFGQVCPAWL